MTFWTKLTLSLSARVTISAYMTCIYLKIHKTFLSDSCSRSWSSLLVGAIRDWSSRNSEVKKTLYIFSLAPKKKRKTNWSKEKLYLLKVINETLAMFISSTWQQASTFGTFTWFNQSIFEIPSWEIRVLRWEWWCTSLHSFHCILNMINHCIATLS